MYENNSKISDIVPVVSNMYPDAFIDVNNDYTRAYNRVKKAIYKNCEHLRSTRKSSSKVEKPNNKENVNSTENETICYKENGQIESDKLLKIYNKSDITPEFLLDMHGFDKNKWKIISYKNNYWNSQGKNNTKLIMVQSKIIVKPYENDELSPYWIRDWFANFKLETANYSFKKYEPKKKDKDILILPIVDLHYNLFTNIFTNVEDYNCEIAKRRLLYVVNDILERTKNKNFHKIILPLGNDLFNANGIKNTTFKGTPQNNEVDMRKAYVSLFEEIVNIINLLKDKAPVDIIFIPSNHDKEITFYFLYNLYTLFEKESKVTVDYKPIVNKYYKFGSTLMMFSHDVNINKASAIVMDEAKRIIDNTEFIEIFLAHLHHETVNNERNITIRRLPTVVSPSDWTTENGYSANKTNQSFIINETNGVSDIIYTRII